jgi:uncharacterized protein
MEHGTTRVAAALSIVVAVAVAGSALGLAATTGSAAPPAAAPACSSAAPKLTVQGTGQATAPPDLLTVAVAVAVTGPSAQASLADDNSKASAVTTAFETGGVLSKDIQTSNVSIQPNYNLGGVITGYQMTNTITAKLRDFSKAGAIVDALTSAAGNATRIDSMTFSIEDPRAIEDQARTDAVRQAVSHATSMAAAAGERLGPVCSLTDNATSPSPGLNDSLAFAAPAAAASVPLEPGTQQTSDQITMVYALEQPARR